MQYGLNKPNVKQTAAKRKPFIKANSKKVDFNKTTKPIRGTQKKEQKPQLHKSKTFKMPKEEEDKPDLRKYTTERQPKQKPKVSSNNNSKQNVAAVESRSRVKKENAYTSRYKSKDVTNTPNGKSFGLLTLKNQMESKNRGDDLDSPLFESKNLVKSLFPSQVSDLRKSQDAQITSSFAGFNTARASKQEDFATRHSLLNLNNVSKEKLKITPLQERRSRTRKIRANTLTRSEIESPIKVNIQPIQKQELAKVSFAKESMEINEHDQLVSYSLFTKLIGKLVFFIVSASFEHQ